MSSTLSRYSQFIRGGMAVFVGNLVGMGLAFLTRVLLGRALGPAGYGLVVLGLTVLYAVETVGNLGLFEGVGRELPRTDEPTEVFTAALLISLASSLLLTVAVGGGVLVAVGWGLGRKIATVVMIFSAGIVPFVLLRVVIAGFRGTKDTFGRVVLLNLVYQIAVIAGVVAMLVIEGTPRSAAAGWVVGLVVTITVGLPLFQVRHRLVGHPRRWRRTLGRHARDLLRFSLPLMVVGSVLILMQQVDNLLVAFFRGEQAVGVYDAAFSLGQLTLAFVWPARFIALPVFSDSDGGPGQFHAVYRLGVKWMVTSSLPLFVYLVVFAPDVIRVVFGEEFVGGAAPLGILATGFFLATLLGLPREAHVAMGNVGLVLRAAVGTVLGNLLLNVVLIPDFGPTGAAIATAVSVVGFNLLLGYALSRRSGVDLLSASTVRDNLAGLVVLVLLFATVAWLLAPTLAVLVVVGVAGAVVHGLIFVVTGGLESPDIALLERADDRVAVDLSPLIDRLRPFASQD